MDGLSYPLPTRHAACRHGPAIPRAHTINRSLCQKPGPRRGVAVAVAKATTRETEGDSWKSPWRPLARALILIENAAHAHGPEWTGRRTGGGWFHHYSLGTNYRLTALQAAPPQADPHSYYLLLGRIEAARFGATRDEFHQALTRQGVPCTPFYRHTLYANPLYQQGGCRVEPCPMAEASIGDAFWLPQRVLMGDEETTREVAVVIRGAGGQRQIR